MSYQEALSKIKEAEDKKSETLDLSGLRLQKIPEELNSLESLRYLDLSNNEIEEIQHFNLFSTLQALNLENNNIRVLPPFLLDLNLPIFIDNNETINNDGLYIGRNPFIQPPLEIIREGIDDIRDYYKQLIDQGSKSIYEAKIMIVGEPDAGKTTLMKKLFDRDYDVPNTEDATLGIDIKKDCSFNIIIQDEEEKLFLGHLWDFGGQYIQLMLHQFFLTSDCIYILMANKRKNFTNFDYWMNAINLMGENSPLIIVFNEKNIKKEEKGADYVFKQQDYRDAFPDLKFNEPIKINLAKKDDPNFDVLIEEIKNNLIGLNHAEHVVPQNWFDVRTELTSFLDQRYISPGKFFEVCKGCGIHNQSFQRQILRYFHLLGIVVYFEDDPNLRDTVFLDHKWTVDAVYSILVHPKLSDNAGIFRINEIYEIWKKKGYGIDDCDKLFRLMLKDKFDLCFKLEGERETYRTPIHLPNVAPEYDWDMSNNLQFRYQYSFMPKGMLSRLIVKMHNYIEDGLVWNEGVVFNDEGARARILERSTTAEGLKYIEIRLTGHPDQRREFLAIIRTQIKNIHKAFFPNLPVEIKVPCICEECKIREEKWFYAYSQLQNLILKKNIDVQCYKSGEKIRIDNLIDSVGVKEIEVPTPGGLRPEDTARLKKLQEIRQDLNDKFNIEQQKYDLYMQEAKETAEYKRNTFVLIRIGVLIFLIWLIYYIGWDSMEKWTFVLDAALTILISAVSFKKGRDYFGAFNEVVEREFKTICAIKEFLPNKLAKYRDELVEVDREVNLLLRNETS